MLAALRVRAPRLIAVICLALAFLANLAFAGHAAAAQAAGAAVAVAMRPADGVDGPDIPGRVLAAAVLVGLVGIGLLLLARVIDRRRASTAPAPAHSESDLDDDWASDPLPGDLLLSALRAARPGSADGDQRDVPLPLWVRRLEAKNETNVTAAGPASERSVDRVSA